VVAPNLNGDGISQPTPNAAIFNNAAFSLSMFEANAWKASGASIGLSVGYYLRTWKTGTTYSWYIVGSDGSITAPSSTALNGAYRPVIWVVIA